MGKTSAAPTSRPTTPPPTQGGNVQSTKPSDIDQVMYQRNLFMSLALNMTWQLAVVVIVPIVGGFKLDEHFNSSPLLTLVGLVIAVGGVVAVLLNIVRQAAVKATNTPEKKK